jgi:hypothetical protein
VTVCSVWKSCDSLLCLEELWQFVLFGRVVAVCSVWKSCDSLFCLEELWQFVLFETVVAVCSVWKSCDSLFSNNGILLYADEISLEHTDETIQRCLREMSWMLIIGYVYCVNLIGWLGSDVVIDTTTMTLREGTWPNKERINLVWAGETMQHWGAFVQLLLQWNSNKYYMLWVCVFSLRCPWC